MRAGTLYGALERLDSGGLIAMDREEIVDRRLRRYYRLTDEGSARLAEEARRLQESAATALRRLGQRSLGLAGDAA
jgi:DNA-binding PadR family transcriptional regulator